jgi:Mycobacterium membrane protein
MTTSTSPSTETSPTAGQTTDAAPVVDTRTVVYTVWGTRRSIDPVTVIYSDEQGSFHTDFNVTLPWSKTITLDANVTRESVTATSLVSQLNCTITDATGAMVASQSHNTIAATCNG